MNAIEVKNLTKSYGKIEAVKNISFFVEQGSFFAFLGPNGAGKSTTIDMLCTFLKPDSGEVFVSGYKLGVEDAKIRASIGTVFQNGVLDPLLTVEENLAIRGGFYNLKGDCLRAAIQTASDATGIGDILKQKYGKLSGGQKRKADIARALLNTPKILFLDEPTTGLDPSTRKHVWDTVGKLHREKGMTVFLTTHYMEEAAEADYVIIIDKGVIAAKGTPAALKEQYASDRLRMSFTPEKKSFLTAYLVNKGLTYWQSGADYFVKLNKTLDAIEILNACKGYIYNFEVLNGTMDDAFITVTGKGISNDAAD